jgi:TonB family protein
MKLFKPFILNAVVACLCAALTFAQSGRKHTVSPGVGRGGAEDTERGDARGDEKATKTQDDNSARDENRIYEGSKVTQKARITRKPLPVYPREARRKRVRGTVRLKIILRADGRVDDHIEVLASLPEGVTEEAIRVAKLIEFEPAEKDGRKVSQYVTVEYGFNIY